jgi:hypothetical protein
LGGELVPRLAFIALEPFFQGLQSELPVAGERRRPQGPWALAGMWFRVVCSGLSLAENHMFATISHNFCPMVDERCVDPLVQVFTRPCKYGPRFYHFSPVILLMMA